VAAKRFIVVEELADRFPAHLLDQVKRAVAHGAIVVRGGERMDRPKAFLQPRVLANIKPDNPAFREDSALPLFSSVLATMMRQWTSRITRISGWGVGFHEGYRTRQARCEPCRRAG
jgi:acyl-CoA reductase-like NAD-dependent aldehyde dehydrogenase